MNGPTLKEIPARKYRSCSSCSFYSNRMVKSGTNPEYRHDCTHTNIEQIALSFEGNLGSDATPDWCPLLSNRRSAFWKTWHGSMETPPFYEGEADSVFEEIYRDEDEAIEFYSDKILFYIKGDSKIELGNYIRFEDGTSVFRTNLGDDFKDVLFWANIPPLP
jgi:hypothetical protein